MAFFFLLLPTLVLSTIQINEPDTLAIHYQDSIVPSITANFGDPGLRSALTGSVIFLSSLEDPCKNGLNNIGTPTSIILVSVLNCEYVQAAYAIQQAGAGGVIFYSNESVSDISKLELNAPNNWYNYIYIYVGMISKLEDAYGSAYADYEISVNIYTHHEARIIPEIKIVLTGDHQLDKDFFSAIYTNFDISTDLNSTTQFLRSALSSLGANYFEIAFVQPLL